MPSNAPPSSLPALHLSIGFGFFTASGKEEEEGKKRKKVVRNSLNKSYPFPPPPPSFLLCKSKAGSCQELTAVPPAPTSPFLTAWVLGNFGGIRGGFRGNQTLTAQPEGRRGEAGRGERERLAAVAPAGACWLLPVGLVVGKQGTEHVGKADNLQSVCD